MLVSKRREPSPLKARRDRPADQAWLCSRIVLCVGNALRYEGPHLPDARAGRARLPWLGLIMVAAILRARVLTAHLLPLAAGFKQSKFRPQGREGAQEKLEDFCRVLEEALAITNKDLDRLILARERWVG